MEFIVIAVSIINFVFTIVVLIMVMNMAGQQKSQSMHTSYLKNQLTFLYERISEITDKQDRLSDSGQKQLTALREELIEVIKAGRLDTARENDDIKFNVKQLVGHLTGTAKK